MVLLLWYGKHTLFNTWTIGWHWITWP